MNSPLNTSSASKERINPVNVAAAAWLCVQQLNSRCRSCSLTLFFLSSSRKCRTAEAEKVIEIKKKTKHQLPSVNLINTHNLNEAEIPVITSRCAGRFTGNVRAAYSGIQGT